MLKRTARNVAAQDVHGLDGHLGDLRFALPDDQFLFMGHGGDAIDASHTAARQSSVEVDPTPDFGAGVPESSSLGGAALSTSDHGRADRSDGREASLAEDERRSDTSPAAGSGGNGSDQGDAFARASLGTPMHAGSGVAEGGPANDFLTPDSLALAPAPVQALVVDTNWQFAAVSPGGDAEVLATMSVQTTYIVDGGGANGAASTVIYEVNSTFDIQINFSGDSRFRAAFDQAITRWQQIITGDIPDYAGIDDLVINATITGIDGVGGILGSAGPTNLRPSSLLPYTGQMQFDSADVESMLSNGTWASVILHEMGHVLGIGTLWDLKGLVSGYSYYGSNALAEYRVLSGNPTATFIPVEDQGGAGTAGGHWRETVFDHEMMTGYVEAPGTAMPISRMTVASLADLGYTVNMGAADAYTMPGGQPPPTTDDFAASTATTGQVAVNGSATGTINSAGDHDWFRVSLVAGRTYTITLSGADSGMGTLSDPILTLRNSAGTALGSDDDSGLGVDSSFVFTATSSGIYYIDAGAYNNLYTGTYRVGVTEQGNVAPVATINNISQHATSHSQLSSLIAYSDSDGNPATQYQFVDQTTAAGSSRLWIQGLGYQQAGATITVAAADLAKVWVGGASAVGTDSMFVRAFDGTSWSTWDQFTVTATNTAPVAVASDRTVHTTDWTQASAWVSYSDANGDSPTIYQLVDKNGAVGSAQIYTTAGGLLAANTTLTVTAAELANVWIGGATVAGITDQMWVRAFDGISWSAWDSFTLTSTNNTPTASINNQSVAAYKFGQAQSWLSYSDADGDAATVYQFVDSGTAAGSASLWMQGRGFHAAGSTPLTVNAADLSKVWIGGGSTTGSETMWVRAFDGASWSAWDQFTFTTTPNLAPAVNIGNYALPRNAHTQVQSLMSYFDVEGDPATMYQFVDQGMGANSGKFFLQGVGYHAAGPTALTVAAADLSKVWIGGATATGTDAMWVRAFDGHTWSAWDPFNFTAV